MARAVFFDRDGVINRALMMDGQPVAPRRFEEFQLIPAIEGVMTSLKEAGFLRIVATNQPDVARGLIDLKELNKMHEYIMKNLAVDEIFVCRHDDHHDCSCRKPKPGMLIEAAKKYGVNLDKAYFIGDTWKDMEAGKRSGCKTVLLNRPYNSNVKADHVIEDVKDVVDLVLGG